MERAVGTARVSRAFSHASNLFTRVTIILWKHGHMETGYVLKQVRTKPFGKMKL